MNKPKEGIDVDAAGNSGRPRRIRRRRKTFDRPVLSGNLAKANVPGMTTDEERKDGRWLVPS
jgi:hypothetical protein